MLGLNLIADLYGDSGQSEAARGLLKALQARNIPVSYVDHADQGNSKPKAARQFPNLPMGYRYPINLLHYNINVFPKLGSSDFQRLTVGKYTAAFWFWELSRLPDTLSVQANNIDEIWVASHFVQNTIALVTQKPIRIVSPVIECAPSSKIERAFFQLPENRYSFLFSFAAPSSFGRKNPWGVVEAFERAFGHPGKDGPLLIIKVHHAEHCPEGRDALRKALERIGGILLDGSYTRQQTDDLLSCTDAFISLHRAEGFGLGMAEAMYLGKPVIATHYSGNVDFMNPTNSYPVRYSLRAIMQEDHRYQPSYASLYELGQLWAEPDIDQAASYMHYLYEHPDDGRQVGLCAANYIRQYLSPSRIGEEIAWHLNQIQHSERRVYEPTFYSVDKRPLKIFFFEFKTFVPGSGWHGPEMTIRDGKVRWFQWTANPTATFDLCLATGFDLQIEFAVMTAVRADILASLTLQANGETIKLTRHTDETGTLRFSGIIPQEVAARNLCGTHLSFNVDRVLSPHASDSEQADVRLRGIALEWLRIISLEPAQPVFFNFDRKLPDKMNWHSPETNNGTTFMWMSAERSWLALPLVATSNLKIEFCVLDASRHDILESLSLNVNDQPVRLTCTPVRPGGFLFHGIIPQTTLALALGNSRLTFHVKELFSPHKLDPHNGDKRLLGVAFNWLRLTVQEGG